MQIIKKPIFSFNIAKFKSESSVWLVQPSSVKRKHMNNHRKNTKHKTKKALFLSFFILLDETTIATSLDDAGNCSMDSVNEVRHRLRTETCHAYSPAIHNITLLNFKLRIFMNLNILVTPYIRSFLFSFVSYNCNFNSK